MYTNYNSQNKNEENEENKENVKDPSVYVVEGSMTPVNRIFSVIWKILLVIILLIVLFLVLIKTGVISLNSDIAPEVVTLNQNEIGLKKGYSYQFVYTVLPENSTNKQVKFESSDESIVRVNETTGYVEALKPGTATITVKTLINDKTNECIVNVSGKSIALKGLDFNEKRVSLAVGYTDTLSYRTSPNNATEVGVQFSSSDESVAKVNSKGVVQGIKPGTAIITASSLNGTVKDTAYVNVYKQGTTTVVNGESVKTETYPSSIDIKEESINLTVGTTNQLTSTISPSGASGKITWLSGNSRVATVNQNGLVTAVGAGTTTIIAKTINNKTDVCTITVGNYSQGLKNIDITTNYSVIPVGVEKKLYVAFIPSNASNKTITWSSNNPSVATVDSSGNVKAIAPGNVIITAQAVDGGFKDTAIIDVVESANIVEETGISFETKVYALGINRTITLNPIIAPSNASFKTIEFKSSNPNIATVDSNGVVKGISAGSATITATTKRNNHSATVTINVSAVPATGVTIKTTKLSMPLGETYTLQSEVIPNNASDTTVTYTSQNQNVATVNSQGIIKAVGVGTTTITVKPNGGGASSTCAVTVTKDGQIQAK